MNRLLFVAAVGLPHQIDAGRNLDHLRHQVNVSHRGSEYNVRMLKRSPCLPLLSILLLLASTPAAADNSFKVYGHRGMVQQYPENTMAAFKACVDAGISIELDVYLTKDGVPVVIHDSTVDRTTNGSGAVADLTSPRDQAARCRFPGTTLSSSQKEYRRSAKRST